MRRVGLDGDRHLCHIYSVVEIKSVSESLGIAIQKEGTKRGGFLRRTLPY